MMTLKEIKQALRDGPYAWPGGYPTYFIAADGEPLSHDAVRERFRTVVADTLGMSGMREFAIAAIDINYENPELFCAHTGKRIPSAYAEDDA